MSDPFNTGGLDTGGLQTGGLRTGRLSNPLDDLSEFAKTALERHEGMQAATRRQQANTPTVETKRTFVEMAPPKGFANPPNKRDETPASVVQDTGVSSALEGAFYTRYLDGAGDTYLQGGQVKCGTSEPLADYKVIDAGTGPTELAGSILVIEITLDGYVEDGVLLAGATATAIAYVSPVALVISADTLPTIASSTGRKCYLEVGRWTADSFLASGVGHFLVSFCGTGSYNVKRY